MLCSLIQTLCFLFISLAYFSSALAAEEPSVISRISVHSSGSQGNGDSFEPVISADGRFIAFRSRATNLIPGDSNGTDDIFVHDLLTGETERVSLGSSGNEGNGGSYYPAISADGRYVTFYSAATNLVANDTSGKVDIFVRDRQASQTFRVSVDASGNEGNGDSYDPVISADGNLVAFYSWAYNLVPGDANATADIFVHDRQTGQTSRVSVGPNGSEGDDQSNSPSMSANGRYVVFYSEAINLVPGDTNTALDIFVHDRQTGETSRVSVDASGNEGNSSSNPATISADGRYVAFHSWASNLVADDTNATQDIFVHDRQTGETFMASNSSSGGAGNDKSYDPVISADGRYVAFSSAASNLVPGDTNATEDLFAHDLQTRKTTRVSVNADGGQGNGSSYDPAPCPGPGCPPDEREVAFPAVSADGGHVAFSSAASNLVPADTNSKWDIFIRVPQFSSFPWAMFLPAISGKP